MKSFIIRELLKPMLARLGTAASFFLVGTLAVSPEVADQIQIGLVAALGVMTDLIVRQVGGTK